MRPRSDFYVKKEIPRSLVDFALNETHLMEDEIVFALLSTYDNSNDFIKQLITAVWETANGSELQTRQKQKILEFLINHLRRIPDEIIEHLAQYDDINTRKFWQHVSKYRDLSEEIISKYVDKVDFFTIKLHNRTLSDEFVVEMQLKGYMSG